MFENYGIISRGNSGLWKTDKDFRNSDSAKIFSKDAVSLEMCSVGANTEHFLPMRTVPVLTPVGSIIFGPGPGSGPGPNKSKILDPDPIGSGSTRRALPSAHRALKRKKQ